MSWFNKVGKAIRGMKKTVSSSVRIALEAPPAKRGGLIPLEPVRRRLGRPAR